MEIAIAGALMQRCKVQGGIDRVTSTKVSSQTVVSMKDIGSGVQYSDADNSPNMHLLYFFPRELGEFDNRRFPAGAARNNQHRFFRAFSFDNHPSPMISTGTAPLKM
jgi:hypothetical protein